MGAPGRRLGSAADGRHDHFAHRHGGIRVQPGSSRLQPRGSRSRTRKAGSTATRSRPSSWTTRPAQPRSRRPSRTQFPRTPLASFQRARCSSSTPGPEPGGRSGHGRVLRRTGVGYAALPVQHVRSRCRQCGPQVPGQHRHRQLLEGEGRHGPLLVRLRHLAVVDPVRHRYGRLIPARRGQGGGARHLHPVRLCGDDDAGARGQAEGLQRLLRRA